MINSPTIDRQSKSTAIKRLVGQDGLVYLSFDDGPDLNWTPRILDLLAASGARATFFMVGCKAQMAASLVRRVMAEGHNIGNHSWSHRHPWGLSPKAARDEVRDGAAAIADITGEIPKFFRPPHGRLRQCMMNEASNSGATTILWSLSAIDWGFFGSAKQIGARLQRVKSNDIVLMHDGRGIHNRPHELVTVLPHFLNSLAANQLQSAELSRRV